MTRISIRSFARVLSCLVLGLAGIGMAAGAYAAAGDSSELGVLVRSYPDPGKVLVSVKVPEDAGVAEGAELKLAVGLTKAGGEAVHRSVQKTAVGMREEVVLDAAELAAGTYAVSVEVRGPDGAVLGAKTEPVQWPGRSEAFKSVRVLNNLVWQLLDARAESDRPLTGDHTIRVPYDRWLFVRSTATKGQEGTVRVSLRSGESEIPLTVHGPDGPETAEAMRFVQAGEHSIRVAIEGQAALERLEVRAVPEIQHSRYPAKVMHVDQGVEYDWEFLERHILPNVNTIITSGPSENTMPELSQWKARGGKVIVYTSRPGLRGKKEPEASPEACAEYWGSRPGYAQPLMDGVLVDEFYHHEDPAYPSYTKAVKLLEARFPGKAFYPYAAGKFGKDEGSIPFAKACIEGGGYVCWEAYLAEWPTLKQGLNALRGYPHVHIMPFEEKLPGLARNTIWVFGVFSFPWPYADGYASVNYNAYLDMQFQFIATHPALFGLGGMHIWRSGYCDEERMRWFGRFFRHYAIEGQTDRLSADPYLLEHIGNPDFAEGVSGWTLESAAEGAIQADEERGFGKFIGRYYRGPDTFLVTARHGEKANIFRQEIRGLEVGRLYSVKMFTGDHGALLEGKSVREIHAVSREIAGAKLRSGPRYAYQQAFPTRGSHGAFTEGKPFWLNYHWQVFEATGPTAVLSISDWKSPKEPGGPVGQRLLYTLIEVKPYRD